MSFKTSKPYEYYRQQVEQNWFFWRPVMERFLSFERAETMTPDELSEFNAAIDYHIERKNAERGG
ncbi:hypothetical protein [Lysinibacillus xylanilyticus]|uniref:hypothetical protein n=1 Tax=Lysinibacillus xylanilyticus TaxID=582475 RepID=UPI003819D932